MHKIDIILTYNVLSILFLLYLQCNNLLCYSTYLITKIFFLFYNYNIMITDTAQMTLDDHDRSSGGPIWEVYNNVRHQIMYSMILNATIMHRTIIGELEN